MNPRLAHLLVLLYPQRWRDRYGAEFETFLQIESSLCTWTNVVWSALCERIIPTQTTQTTFSIEFKVWCARAPWAIFGLGPIFLLAAAYFVACLYLWSGWALFLPGADSPFGGGVGPVYRLSNIYFQTGRFYYFGAPIIVGSIVALIAARQRAKTIWPAFGMMLVALMGGSARIQASRTAVAAGLGHIGMTFALGSSVQRIYEVLLQALVILTLTLLPYLIWRLQKARSLFI